jgi:hypothetical protein
MDGLNSVCVLLMQVTVVVLDGDDLLAIQAALLLKANGKVFHYLEYIL